MVNDTPPTLEHVALTGAASGIGAAVAKKLQQRGVKIATFDIAKPTLPVDLHIPLNLAVCNSISAAIVAARKYVADTQPFDALLNIAGVPPRPEQALNILNINWLGQRRFTGGMLDLMNTNGAIVNMASRAGGRWQENIEQVKALIDADNRESLEQLIGTHSIGSTRAYNLSKEAMIVWALAATAGLSKRRLRMNSLSPAAVDTAILGDFKTAYGPVVEQNLARVGRPGRANEIADAAIFLASPESHWLRGIDLAIDGGIGAMLQAEALDISV